MAERTRGERVRSTPGGGEGGGGEPPSARGHSLDQERAKLAWQWVAEAEKRPESARYGTLARKLPGYLQVSGLGQTLAFLFAKGGDDDKKPEGLLLFQLGQHLKDRGLMQRNRPPMEALVEMSPAEYRQATREAMAVAEWLRRFAAGKLGEAKD